MARTMTRIRLDAKLADEAARVLGAKSRREAVYAALREIVGVRNFKRLTKKHTNKPKFPGFAC